MKQEWKTINENLWACPYEFSGGISRSLLVRMGESKFLVYSPGDRETAELAKQIIPEESELFLLEPNSFHNLGLAAWKACYPQSKSVAAVHAIKRLEKKTGIKPENLDELKKALPTNVSLLELPHNKLGEVWLDIQTGNDRVWTVCDAIFNFSQLPGGLMGLFMKLNRMGPGIEMSRMYQYLGTSNKKSYGDWLLSEIQNKKPTVLVPLHGEIYRDKDLTDKLEAFTRKRILN